MNMRKFNYLVLLCCLFITQGIFAQNMHRAVTLNSYIGAEYFLNKTLVKKYITGGDFEYYMLGSLKMPGATQKAKIAFIRLSSTFGFVEAKTIENINNSLDVNDMIVDPNGDFVFCGSVITNGMQRGFYGKLDGTLHTPVWTRIADSTDVLNSVCHVPNTGTYSKYHFSGIKNNREIVGRSNTDGASFAIKVIDYLGSSFTDNVLFTGVSYTDNRCINVGKINNNTINIFSSGYVFLNPFYKQITIPTPYGINDDVVIHKISTNDYILAVGISRSDNDNCGFLLVRLNFNCIGGVTTMSITDQKMYLFTIGKCLVKDICIDPDEMKICVVGDFIENLRGRPFIAKINANDFTDASARLFAYNYPDNISQWYKLNKILYNPDALSIVSAGSITFQGATQYPGVYIIEGYESPMWESSTCGDEDFAISNITSNLSLSGTFQYYLQANTSSLLTTSTYWELGTSTVKCEGFNGYKRKSIIPKLNVQITDVSIIAKDNSILEVKGIKTTCKYCIYNINGITVSTGNLNSEGIIDIQNLNSGMYVITLSSDNSLLKTSKFIKL